MKQAVILIAILLAPLVARAATEASKPNFVFINIDDLGYADIGPFGSTLNRTPNLDRMAAEGMRLTAFYAAPVCSPSRAALMTGCYPKRALPIPHVLFPGNDVGLAPEEITVAEVLKSAGYSTGMVGKWHLGDQPEFLPDRQGFDLHFGLPYSNDMGPAEDGVKSDLGKPLPAPPKNGKGQPPLPLLRNSRVVKRVLPDDQQSLVEIYTEEATTFIATNQSSPFFLYLAHNAVHFPIYPGKKWAGQSAHGIYSDWVEEVDWSVGKVLEAIRAHGLAEKTLVIFTSDNGGTPRALNRPLRGHKGSTWEGGMRVPTIAWWPGRIPAGASSDDICGMFDILPTFATLAGASLPRDRKIDGADLSAVLTGKPGAPPPHEVFYYYRGLQLEAVRDQEWKLVLPAALSQAARKAAAKGASPENEKATPLLFHLKRDIGESKNVAGEFPEVVARLQKLVDRMQDDLGLSGPASGSRPLGKTPNAQPLIDHDGKVRAGFEPPSPTAVHLRLPDPLILANGIRVTSSAMWRQERRPEILELFRTHVYGRMPVGRPDGLRFETLEQTRGVMQGAATRKQVRISYQGPGGQGAIKLVLFVPEQVKPAPCFLLICNRGPTNIDATRAIKSPFWPAEQIIARGYAAAAFLNADVDPDFHDGFTNGVHGIFDPPGVKRSPEAWGTIAAWAWGASRVMDYLVTDPDIDAQRVAVIGHSRGGKTALWAGAEDERFAFVISNDSGCGGAALARRRQPKAETLAAINRSFPHWFCENYQRYSGREDDLPVDQHMLAALIAPRLLSIASATEDLWADPEGEFLSGREASPVYRLFGKEGLQAERQPPPDTPLQEGSIGYHLRTGKHGLTEHDWKCYMDFADRRWKDGGQ